MIGEVFAALYAGHMVADHWVQSDHQAMTKERSAWSCAKHVITYGMTQVVFLSLLAVVTDWSPSCWPMTIGMLVNLGTHYWADRRAPLKALAARLGKAGYWDRGGAYPLDQSWHIGWLFITALIIGGIA